MNVAANKDENRNICRACKLICSSNNAYALHLRTVDHMLTVKGVKKTKIQLDTVAKSLGYDSVEHMYGI